MDATSSSPVPAVRRRSRSSAKAIMGSLMGDDGGAQQLDGLVEEVLVKGHTDRVDMLTSVLTHAGWKAVGTWTERILKWCVAESRDSPTPHTSSRLLSALMNAIPTNSSLESGERALTLEDFTELLLTSVNELEPPCPAAKLDASILRVLVTKWPPTQVTKAIAEWPRWGALEHGKEAYRARVILHCALRTQPSSLMTLTLSPGDKTFYLFLRYYLSGHDLETAILALKTLAHLAEIPDSAIVRNLWTDLWMSRGSDPSFVMAAKRALSDAARSARTQPDPDVLLSVVSSLLRPTPDPSRASAGLSIATLFNVPIPRPTLAAVIVYDRLEVNRIAACADLMNYEPLEEVTGYRVWAEQVLQSPRTLDRMRGGMAVKYLACRSPTAEIERLSQKFSMDFESALTASRAHSLDATVNPALFTEHLLANRISLHGTLYAIQRVLELISEIPMHKELTPVLGKLLNVLEVYFDVVATVMDVLVEGDPGSEDEGGDTINGDVNRDQDGDFSMEVEDNTTIRDHTTAVYREVDASKHMASLNELWRGGKVGSDIAAWIVEHSDTSAPYYSSVSRALASLLLRARHWGLAASCETALSRTLATTTEKLNEDKGIRRELIENVSFLMSDSAPTRHDHRYAGASRVLRACIVSSKDIHGWALAVSRTVAKWGTAQTLHVLRWLYADKEVGQGLDADEGFEVAMRSANHQESASRTLMVAVMVRAIGDSSLSRAHTFPAHTFAARFPRAFAWCEKEISDTVLSRRWTRSGLVVALALASRMSPHKDVGHENDRLKNVAKDCVYVACKCEIAALREMAGRAVAGLVTQTTGVELVHEVIQDLPRTQNLAHGIGFLLHTAWTESDSRGPLGNLKSLTDSVTTTASDLPFVKLFYPISPSDFYAMPTDSAQLQATFPDRLPGSSQLSSRGVRELIVSSSCDAPGNLDRVERAAETALQTANESALLTIAEALEECSSRYDNIDVHTRVARLVSQYMPSLYPVHGLRKVAGYTAREMLGVVVATGEAQVEYFDGFWEWLVETVRREPVESELKEVAVVCTGVVIGAAATRPSDATILAFISVLTSAFLPGAIPLCSAVVDALSHFLRAPWSSRSTLPPHLVPKLVAVLVTIMTEPEDEDTREEAGDLARRWLDEDEYTSHESVGAVDLLDLSLEAYRAIIKVASPEDRDNYTLQAAVSEWLAGCGAWILPVWEELWLGVKGGTIHQPTNTKQENLPEMRLY
ncbi:hypothetical protein HDU93_008909 [Gonapodya sp. JEL0774]|nr:hypothetical protein HDU93_008909 [Gonapodya sp. JEL0774]